MEELGVESLFGLAKDKMLLKPFMTEAVII